jgi:protease I
MSSTRGQIAVVIEEHFDETEYRHFNEVFPQNGYDVTYVSNLWNQPSLTFKGNEHTAEVTVTVDFTQVEPTDYAAIILVGGYAMDRLRYQTATYPGQPNQSPAVQFLRKAVEAMDQDRLKIGTICHSLWLFCADPPLLHGRRVTCAHNIVCDVENAGGTVVYDGGETVSSVVDGNLIAAKHPGVVDEFTEILLDELKKQHTTC